MKRFLIPLAITAFLASGCVHHVPVTTEHSLPLDWEFLGLWELVPGEATGDPSEDLMLILKWSETEYLAQFPQGEKGDFYRAYPVEVAGRVFIQAQSLGSPWGDVHEGDRVVYPLLSYRIVEGILMISTLNVEVVDEHIADGDALRAAIEANINRQDLFGAPAHYRRPEQ